MLPNQLERINKTVASKNKDNPAQQHTDYFNIRTKPLNYFEPGDLVRVRNTFTGKWDTLATISSRRPDNRSYIIAIVDKEYTPGRRLLQSASQFSRTKKPTPLPLSPALTRIYLDDPEEKRNQSSHSHVHKSRMVQDTPSRCPKDVRTLRLLSRRPYQFTLNQLLQVVCLRFPSIVALVLFFSLWEVIQDAEKLCSGLAEEELPAKYYKTNCCLGCHVYEKYTKVTPENPLGLPGMP